MDTTCQRHVLNPSDPAPGAGCVNPPPNSNFYPFYSTRNTSSGCMWQEGGPYIPGTTNKFGGSAQAEYGPLRVINYPTAPFGTGHQAAERLPQRYHGQPLSRGLTRIHTEFS